MLVRRTLSSACRQRAALAMHAMSTDASSTDRLYPAVAQSAACVILSRQRPGEQQTEYALVRRGNPPNALQWSFPGGRVELGKTILETAQMELEEETGIMRDRVMWHSSAVGCIDVIVQDDCVESSDDGERKQIVWYQMRRSCAQS